MLSSEEQVYWKKKTHQFRFYVYSDYNSSKRKKKKPNL